MSRPLLLLCIVAAFVIAFLAIRHWSPTRVVERKQAALVAALERRSNKHLDRLLSENYSDQWGFDREDVKLAMGDIGSQFIILNLVPQDPALTVADGIGESVMRFEASGNGSPLAHQIIREINQLETPFLFRWEKLGFWPGDWHLVRIENPDLDDELRGYEPGDLRRALELD